MAPPPALEGVLALLAAGALLGLVGWLRPPAWQLRAVAIAALVGAALVLNLAWFPILDRRNGPYAFAREPDADLRRRYGEHSHWIPRFRMAYFHARDRIAGRAVGWIPGTGLEPWRLVVLGGAREVTELPASSRLPSLAFLQRLPAETFAQLGRWKEEPLTYRLLIVRHGAGQAARFVAARIDDVDVLVPESVWSTALRLEQER